MFTLHFDFVFHCICQALKCFRLTNDELVIRFVCFLLQVTAPTCSGVNNSAVSAYQIKLARYPDLTLYRMFMSALQTNQCL